MIVARIRKIGLAKIGLAKLGLEMIGLAAVLLLITSASVWAQTAPSLTSPTPGSTLASSTVTFQWQAGSAATAYWLDLGTSPGGNTIFQSGNLGSATSVTVSGLPTNGSAVDATLWYYVNGSWLYNSYSFTALNAIASSAVLTSPNPGSALSSGTVTFNWSAGSGASAYWLDAGTTAGGNQYYQSGNLGTSLTTTVSGLATDGSTIYVTLYSLVGGGWTANAYTYTAATLSPAVIASPTPGSAISATSATFSWTAVAGTTGYSLDIGSGFSANNIFQSGNVGTGTSVTVSNLPSTPIMATLYTQLDGVWRHTQAIYTAPPTQVSSSSYGATSGQFHSVSSMTSLTPAQKLTLLQNNIKYVFVVFQENRSYDHYFGTFPGSNGLFSTYPGANASDPTTQPGNTLSSFNSVIQTVSPSGAVSFSTVSPFLVPRTIVNQNGASTTINSEDMYSVDHSHTGYISDLHSDQSTRSVPKNDGYALDQEGLYYGSDSSGTSATIYKNSGTTAQTANVTLQTKQKGEIVLGHVDCDTIPFLWQYADRFTLFDNMHQTAIGPSTPNAIAMIGAQTGDTQWVLHPSNYDSYNITYGNTAHQVAHAQYSLPNVTDSAPFPGSLSDTATVLPPYGPDESIGRSPSSIGTPAVGTETLTFASLPLSFMGNQINSITANDQHASFDLTDVTGDFTTIATNPNVSWGWYQQGFGAEPFDSTAFCDDEENTSLSSPNNACYTSAPAHAAYIVHHNGPQYFGYLGDNTTEQGNMHGLQQFTTDVAGSNLNPGVYYIRGGYYNNLNQVPADSNPTVQSDFTGNDDHGSYSDSQISESMVANTINAIANSPYWSQSAIIITYDESDGFFDHQPEQFRTYGPDGEPESGGPRIPLIVVSPFAVTHGVSHVYSEHSSVVRFIEELKGLVPLGQLPVEAAAFNTGANLCSTAPTYGSGQTPTFVAPGGRATSTTINPFCLPNGSPQTALGPADTNANMGDLSEAFDNDRLLGNPNVPVLPASYVTIPAATVSALPHYSAVGACSNSALGIVPTDYTNGYSSAAFDPTGAQTAVPVIDPPPADFNPRPTVSLGSPYYNTNSNTTANSTTGTGSPWPH